ncbi:uncharacterized protein LOC111262152 [Varroa jacobsoni]|uniref:uncharacterized protein LOC111262152 n=1 Tax=Varroa jacobsoni TaxID=62625 RepID=UPI000BF7DEA0|nr:uncharacterized protein LOC111262152 [Varroa jacobsoni]
MANIKKHFGFKVGGCGGGISGAGVGSVGILQSPQTANGELLLPGFSKSAFMNEVSSLLDHCGLYVSAMNDFCTSGCSLAKCLVKVFHAVPLYRETASTLLANWEEIAQTTAAASASVKTETLMQLQDVLTRLEGQSKEDRETELTESVHAVSSCLMAYIELQAQFSYLVFKALGKLSRQQGSQQQSGFLKNSSRAEEAVRKQFAQIINRLTGPSVKTPTSPMATLSTTPSTPQTLPQVPIGQHAVITTSACGSSVWPAEIHLAPSGGELSSALPESTLASVSEADAEDSGLDDVINLLSIGGAATPGPSPVPSGPPKVPPRPDALSQDAFRLKQQLGASRAEVAVSKKTSEPAITSWSPFAPSQWGNPEWSTEDLSSNWQHSTGSQSHRSSETESDSSRLRWQTDLGVAPGAVPGATGAKEKTSTWPRPLRDPAAPWEWPDRDDNDDELLTLEGTSRDTGERAAKTCTWPLKMADGAWSLDPREYWSNKESVQPELSSHRGCHPDRVAPPWERPKSPEHQAFQLFNSR